MPDASSSMRSTSPRRFHLFEPPRQEGGRNVAYSLASGGPGREIERSLGRLSNSHLRDVGLTEFDLEAACADSFDRCASRALMSVAQKRSGNW